MGAREKKVEQHLSASAYRCGGLARKWVCPGRSGVTDQIVIVPTTVEDLIKKLQSTYTPDTIIADVYFVEVKTDDGRISEVQAKEHNRLIDKGAQVVIVHGEFGVNEFIGKVFK